MIVFGPETGVRSLKCKRCAMCSGICSVLLCVYLLLSGWQTSQLSCTWLVEYRASEKLASENNRHLATLPLVFLPNDVCETSAEIPY